MIQKTLTTRYTIDIGVIPVSNDRTRFPFRAQYGRKNLVWTNDQFSVLLDTTLFTNQKKDTYEIRLACTCFVCRRSILNQAMEVGYLHCSNHHIARNRGRDVSLGAISVEKPPTTYPVACKYIVENRQPYITYVHTNCYEQYQLNPLGFNLESRTHIFI